MKIAIRFFTSNNSDVDIVAILLTIQFQLNNSFNATTDLTFNEIIYEFKIRDTISAFIREQTTMKSISNRRQKYQTKVSDAIAFANAKMKVYYDFKHKSLLLKFENKVYFRFNKEYKLSEHHKKLSQQRCESFLIKRRIERLTYELNLFATWKIHFVIFIAQLKSISNTQNLYNKFKFHHSEIVKIEKDTEYEKFYEIERILIKRIRKYERIAVTQYLIKWLDYEFEFNEWKSLFIFDHCLKLIEKFEQRQRDRISQ